MLCELISKQRKWTDNFWLRQMFMTIREKKLNNCYEFCDKNSKRHELSNVIVFVCFSFKLLDILFDFIIATQKN